MKKHMNFIIPVIVMLAMILTGCDDALKTITQQVPYSKDVTLTGAGTSFEQTATINLNESDFYNTNQGKIKKIEFLKISYKTKSVTPADLTGNITVTLKQGNGVLLLSSTVAGNKPSDYLTNPYELIIPQAEIQFVNAYLATQTNRTIIATVKFDTATTGTKTIEGQIFIALQMEYEP